MPLSTLIGRSLKTLAAVLLLAQTTPARADIDVYDSGKQFLGSLMDIHSMTDVKAGGQQIKVMLSEISRMLIIDAATGSLVTPAGTSIWYRDRRCIGAPFVDRGLFYAVGKFDGYYTGVSQEPVKIQAWSQLKLDACGHVTCTAFSAGNVVLAVPALEFKELPVQFPVKLPMWFVYE
jgi:hypothetical protein